jgi:hypothetical protein
MDEKNKNVSPSRRSKYVSHLESIDAPQLTATVQNLSIWAKGTNRSHQATKLMYGAFLAKFHDRPSYLNCSDEDLFPLRSDSLQEFVFWLWNEVRYSYQSIMNIHLGNLLRMSCYARQEPHSPQLKLTVDTIRRKLKIAEDARQKVEGQHPLDLGKEPCTAHDLFRIIKNIPAYHLGKAEEASAFTLALHVGARAITVTEISVHDILQVLKTGDGPRGPLIVVRIRLRVLKNQSNANHIISLEGCVYGSWSDDSCQLDAVYWLNQHLLLKFGLNLLQFNSRIEGWKRREALYRWTPDGISHIFVDRSEQAGYKYRLFSFHSLRSGFMATVLLGFGVNGDNKGILEMAALIAGWTPFGKAQLRYIKSLSRQQLIASRLIIDVSEYEKNQSLINSLLASDVHMIHSGQDIAEPSWKTNFQDTISFHVVREVSGLLTDKFHNQALKFTRQELYQVFMNNLRFYFWVGFKKQMADRSQTVEDEFGVNLNTTGWIYFVMIGMIHVCICPLDVHMLF